MTDQRPWERLDLPAATPRRAGGAVTASGGSPAGRPAGRRLQRSRTPVMAAFDHGGDAFQRHARTVLVGSAALLAPLVAVNLWVTVVGFDRFDPDDSLFPSFGSGTRSGIEDLAPFLGAVATSLATAVVGWFVALVVLGDRLAGVAADRGGDAAGRGTPGLGRSLLHTLRRLPAIVTAWLLGHWWQPLLVAVTLSVDAADAAGLIVVFGPLALFASAATLYAMPAMVAERLGPIAALRRSWRLFRRSVGSAVLVVFLSTVLGSLYLVGIATIAPLLEANGFVDFGGAAWIVQGVLVQLGVLIVMPLVAACTAQAYVEVRLDREGLDLLLDAQAAFPHTDLDASASADPVGSGAPT